MKVKFGNVVKSMRKKEAFTLIEMVLVLFIVAALLLLIIPNMSQQATNAQNTTDNALIETVETQMELYALEKNGTRPSVETLVSGGYITAEQAARYETAKTNTSAE